MSDWNAAFRFQDACPHTFNALQKFTMAMQDYQKNKGKTTLFGNDKGLKYYKNYEEKLKDLVYALTLDGMLDRNSSGEERLKKVVGAQLVFWDMFPGWDHAKVFFTQTFIDGEKDAITQLERIV